MPVLSSKKKPHPERGKSIVKTFRQLGRKRPKQTTAFSAGDPDTFLSVMDVLPAAPLVEREMSLTKNIALCGAAGYRFTESEALRSDSSCTEPCIRRPSCFPEDAKRSPVAASIVLMTGDLWYSLFLASSLNNPETGGRRLKRALYGYLSKASTRAMPLQSSSAYLEALRNSAVAHSASGMCRSGCSEAHAMAISMSLSMRPRVKTGA